MEGEAVVAIRETAIEVAGRIGRAHDRYDGVATALEGYVEPLRTAQNSSLSLLDQAESLRTDRDHAHQRTDYWHGELQRLMYGGGDEREVDEARDKYVYWNNRAVSLQNDIAGLVSQLNTVIEARDTAAEKAAKQIEKVDSSGDLNDSIWDNVDQFLTENPWIDGFLAWAGWIAAALVIVAMFIPGLNVIAAAVAIAVAVAVSLNALAKAATGRISPWEAVFEIGLAVLPFGIGKLAKGAVAAFTPVVATSRMTSAAGSGIKGVTRTVALEWVEAAIKRPNAFAVGSKAETFLNISTMSKTVLLSGKTSAPVAAAAFPTRAWMVADAATNIIAPAASTAASATGLFSGLESYSARNEKW
ncbi:hypothetical protein [Salinibacterium sp. ZJ70]|uniref:hypothetical protein n=1 Tax=Salinibacterium sp. ZJ70 TaxID=2708084 RepID=UPI00141D9734|nr:hypothetical protein [Salinibacterium sp. ZJ70]